MNKIFFFFVIVGFVAIQTVESRAAARNSSPAAQNVQEGDLSKKAKEVIKKAEETLAGNLPDTQQIVAKVEEGGQKLINSIKDLNDFVKKQIADNKGTIDESLKTLSENLHAASEKIQKDVLGPNGQKKATEIKENLFNQIKATAGQVEKLAEGIKPEAEKMKNDLLSFAHLFLEKAEKVTDDLKKAVTDAKKN